MREVYEIRVDFDKGKHIPGIWTAELFRDDQAEKPEIFAASCDGPAHALRTLADKIQAEIDEDKQWDEDMAEERDKEKLFGVKAGVDFPASL